MINIPSHPRRCQSPSRISWPRFAISVRFPASNQLLAVLPEFPAGDSETAVSDFKSLESYQKWGFQHRLAALGGAKASPRAGPGFSHACRIRRS